MGAFHADMIWVLQYSTVLAEYLIGFQLHSLPA